MSQSVSSPAPSTQSHSAKLSAFSVSLIMLSKLIGGDCRRNGVDALLSTNFMRLSRGGELPGLGVEDDDEADEFLLQAYKFEWLRVEAAIWLPVRILKIRD